MGHMVHLKTLNKTFRKSSEASIFRRRQFHMECQKKMIPSFFNTFPITVFYCWPLFIILSLNPLNINIITLILPCYSSFSICSFYHLKKNKIILYVFSGQSFCWIVNRWLDLSLFTLPHTLKAIGRHRGSFHHSQYFLMYVYLPPTGIIWQGDVTANLHCWLNWI